MFYFCALGHISHSGNAFEGKDIDFIDNTKDQYILQHF